MAKAVEHIELETLSQSEGTGAPLCPRDMNLFGHVNVEITAEIGHAEISIEKLLAFKFKLSNAPGGAESKGHVQRNHNGGGD